MKIIEEKKYVFNNKLDRIELDNISINSFSVVHVETMLSFLKARGLKFNVYQNSFKYEWFFQFENLSLRFKSAKEFCKFLLPVFVSERNKQRSEYHADQRCTHDTVGKYRLITMPLHIVFHISRRSEAP